MSRSETAGAASEPTILQRIFLLLNSQSRSGVIDFAPAITLLQSMESWRAIKEDAEGNLRKILVRLSDPEIREFAAGNDLLKELFNKTLGEDFFVAFSAALSEISTIAPAEETAASAAAASSAASPLDSLVDRVIKALAETGYHSEDFLLFVADKITRQDVFERVITKIINLTSPTSRPHLAFNIASAAIDTSNPTIDARRKYIIGQMLEPAIDFNFDAIFSLLATTQIDSARNTIRTIAQSIKAENQGALLLQAIRMPAILDEVSSAINPASVAKVLVDLSKPRPPKNTEIAAIINSMDATTIGRTLFHCTDILLSAPEETTHGTSCESYLNLILNQVHIREMPPARQFRLMRGILNANVEMDVTTMDFLFPQLKNAGFDFNLTFQEPDSPSKDLLTRITEESISSRRFFSIIALLESSLIHRAQNHLGFLLSHGITTNRIDPAFLVSIDESDRYKMSRRLRSVLGNKTLVSNLLQDYFTADEDIEEVRLHFSNLCQHLDYHYGLALRAEDLPAELSHLATAIPKSSLQLLFDKVRTDAFIEVRHLLGKRLAPLPIDPEQHLAKMLCRLSKTSNTVNPTAPTIFRERIGLFSEICHHLDFSQLEELLDNVYNIAFSRHGNSERIANAVVDEVLKGIDIGICNAQEQVCVLHEIAKRGEPLRGLLVSMISSQKLVGLPKELGDFVLYEMGAGRINVENFQNPGGVLTAQNIPQNIAQIFLHRAPMLGNLLTSYWHHLQSAAEDELQANTLLTSTQMEEMIKTKNDEIKKTIASICIQLNANYGLEFEYTNAEQDAVTIVNPEISEPEITPEIAARAILTAEARIELERKMQTEKAAASASQPTAQPAPLGATAAAAATSTQLA